MNRITCNQVNAALRRAGIEGKIRRGRGYFYFVGADFDRCYGTSVYVYRLEAFTLEGWIREAQQMIGDAW
jgi:hypothetical protein